MKLVIVESPTKARTLSKFLGNDYEIQASMGHIVDLPKSKLGVDVEHQFEPQYEPVKGKHDIAKKLQDLAAKAETVYLATDPDREGEAIAWHITNLLAASSASKKRKAKSEKKINFQRVTFHEITKTAIEEALKHPGELNIHLVDAQQARRVVDRLVGYNLSPVLWKKVRRGLSAGRVQSVALRLIVEREQEIKAFKQEEYWIITVKVVPDESRDARSSFWVELFEIGGKKIEIREKQENGAKSENRDRGVIYVDSQTVVTPITDALKKAAYVVEKVEKKERIARPYAPYTTSTLQQAGANVLGYSSKQTMQLAQNLYEAGFITYHRTDSLNLAVEAVNQARAFIAKEYGKEQVPDKPVFYKTTSKNAQEAHEAIRPTDVVGGAELRLVGFNQSGLTEQHRKLYDLIWKRFVACQMKAAIYDQTTVTVMAKSDPATSSGQEERNATYRLRTTGSVMKFEGWKKLYAKSDMSSTKQKGSEEVELPPLTTDEQLVYQELKSEQKATQPPPRYNDASLVKELEKRGIGRPSTYASIISTIIARGYTEKQEKRFYPSVLGETVVEFLKKHFGNIVDYAFTAEMEEDLDRIARSEKAWRNVMSQFYEPFAKTLKVVEDSAERMKVPVEETGEMCPTCKEGKLVIRSGRFGKFISCSRFPECKHTAKLTQKLEDFPCPQCQGEVVLKRTRKGRSFWGCKNYPQCDYASWKDPRIAK